MFKKLLETDFFKYISETASKNIIKKDRDSYKNIFDISRETIENDEIVVISNPMKILGLKQNLEEKMTIYTTHTRRTTTMLANAIHNKIGKLVQMRSIIPNEEYEIMYNMRGLIKIYHIERYKNIKIPEIFNTIKINKLYYFPPEIELMNIYHKLYLPNYYDEWDSNLNLEKLFFPRVMEIEKTLASNIKSEKTKDVKLPCSKCKISRKDEINNIKLLILKYLNNENYVIIGKWSHNIIENKDIVSTDNIQIISENDIEQDYNNILNYLSNYTKFGIYYKKKKLYIPKDNRIYSYVMFIKYKSEESIKNDSIIDKPFLDIYNNGNFELVPFIEKKIKINSTDINVRVGNLFVQMRFLLIDLWVYRLLKFLKYMNENEFNIRCKNLFITMKNMKKLLPYSFTDKYMGINYDEKIEQKIEISKNNIKKSNYFPELNIKKEKKYKLIATSS